MFELTKKDLTALKGIHPDLVRVVMRAAKLSPIRFKITEGLRTLERQRQLKAQGFSWTLRSRHLTGHAVDVAPIEDVNGDGRVTSADLFSWATHRQLSKFMKQAAEIERVPIEWGGDWHSSPDGPHYQLPWNKYPAPQTLMAELEGPLEGEPPYTTETVDVAVTKDRSATVALGGSSATAIAAPAIPDVVNSIERQQFELTSGSWLRVGLALLVVGLTIYAFWRRPPQ